jgi:hypothetical protein
LRILRTTLLFNWRFEQSGATCGIQHVADGAAAVEFLRTTLATNPDGLPRLIFLDLKMAVINGF